LLSCAPQIHKPALFPKTVKHLRPGRRIGIARWKCGNRLTQIHRGFSSSLSVRMARRCKPPRSRCDRQLVEIAKTAVQPSPLDHSRTPTAEYPGRRQVAPGCPMTGWDSSHEDREPSPTSWTPRLRSRPDAPAPLASAAVRRTFTAPVIARSALCWHQTVGSGRQPNLSAAPLTLDPIPEGHRPVEAQR
jgi:hypothetical protein